ncbi:MAG: hypothetical protein JWM49_2295 [Microbacteriaceae bacterium]|jgi:hypothetical protein|nr:hypothetical protein [Microbacteriaceae bacterium]
MANFSSTTLIFVGNDAPRALLELDHLANVRASTLAEESEADFQRWVSRSNSPFLVHDRDPLAHVASAWVEFFDDLATLGTLDLEVDRVLDALARGETSMPDYYIVADPEGLSPTWKHWWLGVLPEAAPTRVIPWREGSMSLARVIRYLPTGRPWPKAEPWLRRVARAVPDRVGLS